jgi:hypothetical protein
LTKSGTILILFTKKWLTKEAAAFSGGKMIQRLNYTLLHIKGAAYD